LSDEPDWVDERLIEWAPYVRGGPHGVDGGSAGYLRERLEREFDSSYMPPSVEITEKAVARVRVERRITMPDWLRMKDAGQDPISDWFRVLILYYVVHYGEAEIASRWGRTEGFIKMLRKQAKGRVGTHILALETK